MDPLDIVRALTGEPGRGAGTDAERRAMLRVAERLRAGGREVQLQQLWVRPQRALVLAGHALVGAAASVVAVGTPRVAAVILAATFVSLVLDALGSGMLLRRLTPERASQNAVALPPGGQPALRLVVTAACDAPRGGWIHRRLPARIGARLRRLAGGRLPSGQGLLALAVVALLAIAAGRARGVDGAWLDAIQFALTAGLLVTVALALDVAISPPTPGANAGASAVAAAATLVARLDADPPRHVSVELVLAGSGDGGDLGLRRYVAARRRQLPPEGTVLLALAPCGAGRPRWWTREGALLPRRVHPHLLELCDAAAAAHPELGAAPERASTHGGIARLAGWAGLTVGALDERGLASRARRADDVADALDADAIEATVAFAHALVIELDRDVAARAAAGAPAAAR